MPLSAPTEGHNDQPQATDYLHDIEIHVTPSFIATLPRPPALLPIRERFGLSPAQGLALSRWYDYSIFRTNSMHFHG